MLLRSTVENADRRFSICAAHAVRRVNPDSKAFCQSQNVGRRRYRCRWTTNAPCRRTPCWLCGGPAPVGRMGPAAEPVVSGERQTDGYAMLRSGSAATLEKNNVNLLMFGHVSSRKRGGKRLLNFTRGLLHQKSIPGRLQRRMIQKVLQEWWKARRRVRFNVVHAPQQVPSECPPP